ncbi:MAG: isoprenylcysteine carboxylmethyltransferase family protein [Anaerolineae bacterium]|nr:isoprenylcysteine carboxylmethyltransferase family protein [Anaerolineae bacterium]
MKQAWWTGSRGEWYVVIQIFLFALVGLGPKQMVGLPQWPPSWSIIGLGLGILLGLLGLALALAGLFHLGANLTVVPYPKEDSSLVQSGVYSLVRHPIYSGLIIGAFGWGFLFTSTLTLLYALLLFLFFDIKSRREERWLAAKFPAYPAYQQRVRKLIPFIY